MEIRRDVLFAHEEYGVVRIEAIEERIDGWNDGKIERSIHITFVELRGSGPVATNLVHIEPIDEFRRNVSPM